MIAIISKFVGVCVCVCVLSDVSQKRRLQTELQDERAAHVRQLAAERERCERELREAREADQVRVGSLSVCRVCMHGSCGRRQCRPLCDTQRTAAALKEDTERTLAEAARRQAVEAQSLREQLAIEKESWEEMFMRKQQMNLREKVVPVCGWVCL